MLFAVVVGILVGFASLLAACAVLLIPAALLARFFRRVETAESVVLRPATRAISAATGWSQAHPGA
jgi:hypothetical protein